MHINFLQLSQDAQKYADHLCSKGLFEHESAKTRVDGENLWSYFPGVNRCNEMFHEYFCDIRHISSVI